ncbi:uncharacterized protein MYCFIDRAFT_211577 [Pseudocercospora fijiensis CIRAD86]|uniref:Uncharacterized protein n=1 Tax=Pseudocercospora fijiensis (strain CIRAD86) TaxID=383855 RepID=M3AYL3_PSEFD|nr:uncharacterized protein MYCFIDRAFT_211577 [Pseudocercospora fijiensis CIRAD86]EME82262.1 hypothetical protein MYCFIDRAFT_211577 [Pseudocercospora fijiensis CIRAD86]
MLLIMLLSMLLLLFLLARHRICCGRTRSRGILRNSALLSHSAAKIAMYLRAMIDALKHARSTAVIILSSTKLCGLSFSLLGLIQVMSQIVDLITQFLNFCQKGVVELDESWLDIDLDSVLDRRSLMLLGTRSLLSG